MSEPAEQEPRGLIIVHTGDGKGKTTAALGMCLRAVGGGLRVCVLQYIKGQWKPGELKAAGMLPRFDYIPMGVGFTWTKTPEEHMAALREAWAKTQEVVLSGQYDIVVLDEINYALALKTLPVAEVFTPADVLDLLRRRPPALHVVLTGRGAHSDIVEYADLVTEMKLIKHPYQKGIKAARGVEF
ncbi:MAG TPA: cob(I)yrinic acid a,c-diamide adenosyltransferase [Bacillota bacterium]|nr:cob(I)yrinic acid a,c-diamide adenosyltransferase [Bacillota bacterium]